MDLIHKYAVELLIGALGYNVRKYFGEQISKYILSPIWKKLKQYVFSPLFKWTISRLIRSERDAAIWMHRRNRHHAKSSLQCTEGKCNLVR